MLLSSFYPMQEDKKYRILFTRGYFYDEGNIGALLVTSSTTIANVEEVIAKRNLTVNRLSIYEVLNKTQSKCIGEIWRNPNSKLFSDKKGRFKYRNPLS